MRKIAVLTISIFCLTAAVAVAAQTDLVQIQKAIDQQGRSWIAAENAISVLTRTEKQAMLGAWDEPVFDGDRLTLASRSLPASFTWDSKGGESWITPIKNQGQCGSCWAFAGCGALETLVKIAYDDPAINLDLSEQYMVSCSAGSCSGWYLSSTMTYLQTTGVPDELCLGYGAVDSIPCGSACADWADRSYSIDGWSWLSTDVTSLKTAVETRPVPVSMSVYEDFYYYSGGVYEHTYGDYEGGHAVILIGWDDSLQAWHVKNSWGTYWGEGGYFWIRWNDSDFADFATYMELTATSDDNDEDGCLNDDDPFPDSYSADSDGDGFGADCDCDDTDQFVNPDMIEICLNMIDDNCDGNADEGCPTCAALPTLKKGGPITGGCIVFLGYLTPVAFLIVLRRKCRR